MRALVTGGAGFIGCNLVNRLLARGDDVLIYDNLSRRGATRNLEWLRSRHGGRVRVAVADVRDAAALAGAARDIDVLYHLAAQVAVTTSVTDPRTDFELNALGTFNALEAARQSPSHPSFLYASTNKVYGGMETVGVVEHETRWAYADLPQGVSEAQPLDFHSPYGCSKGAGDQYTRDYARIYGLRTIVMRQSCIYGPRQFGVEDQGWLAWFAIAATLGRPITLYGDGKQVRDVLHVDDLIDAYDAALAHIDEAAGQVYNVGGGPINTISVWKEFGPILEDLLGQPVPVAYSDWRPGDQKVFVSDVGKARRELDWTPKTGVRAGLADLVRWVRQHVELFS